MRPESGGKRAIVIGNSKMGLNPSLIKIFPADRLLIVHEPSLLDTELEVVVEVVIEEVGTLLLASVGEVEQSVVLPVQLFDGACLDLGDGGRLLTVEFNHIGVGLGGLFIFVLVVGLLFKLELIVVVLQGKLLVALV